MTDRPHRVILNLATKIIEYDQQVEDALGYGSPLVDLLQRHLDEDVETIARHEPLPRPGGASEHDNYCGGCGFDDHGEPREDWPCPAIAGLAKVLGVQL